MAGVDLEPDHPNEQLTDVLFRRCTSVNNSGADFQVYLAGLNASSQPVSIVFEDCTAGGVGYQPFKPPNHPVGYYFSGFGGQGAGGSIQVTGGTVSGTSSFGAAVFDHG